jgi:hypothetical protein
VKQLKDRLNLASEAEGLFFFINSKQYKVAARDLHAATNYGGKIHRWANSGPSKTQRVNIRRLAAIRENINSMVSSMSGAFYSENTMINLSFFVSLSAGACAFWFNGSWVDMLNGVGCLRAWWGGLGCVSPLLLQHSRITRSRGLFFYGWFHCG